MKLYSDCGDYQVIRISKEELQEEPINKGDLIYHGKTLYRVWGFMEDGHGNMLILAENPVTIHEYR